MQAAPAVRDGITRLAQALYNTLRRIGPDCQFLVTTHSGAVTAVVPEDEITRIPGGRLCL